MSVVVDSSVVLAAMLDEPGADRAWEALSDGILSAVNAAEIVSRLLETGFSREDAASALHKVRLDIRPFALADALATARLRAPTKAKGLSLGDRACLALALSTNSRVVTADRAWAGLDVGVDIEVIR